MACPTCHKVSCLCRPAAFTSINELNVGNTLVAQLAHVADHVRDIGVCLGQKLYQVNLIWTRWSGGARGVGNEEVVAVRQLLPTPMVPKLTQLKTNLESQGTLEVGQLTLSEISVRYSEDLLQGRDVIVAPGADLPEDVSFYYEIWFPEVGRPGPRRRFTPNSAPDKDPTNFQWTITLVRSGPDRERSGDL